MSIDYRVIEIFTHERATFNGHSLTTELVKRVRDLRIAARCVVSRGIAGCYENGDIATQGIEVLSFDMPRKIEVIFPAAELERILPIIHEVVTDGIALIRGADILVHRVSARLLPPNLRVMDIMTPHPKTVSLTDTAADALRILLAGSFNGLPVVDSKNHPVGMITQGDFIRRAGMPIRLGLLRELGTDTSDAVIQQLSVMQAADFMTQPAASLSEELLAQSAVDRMLKQGLKRMPVINKEGSLTGILSRVDIFKTIMRKIPDWSALSRHGVEISNARKAADIMYRDVHKVLASTPIENVMRIIDDTELQRVAVIDDSQRLLGIISDRDLLGLFADHKTGLWDRLASRMTFTAMGQRHKAALEKAHLRTAGEIMRIDIISVREETPLDEVIRLMTSKQLKRLPVTGTRGELLGMITREAVLRASLEDSPG